MKKATDDWLKKNMPEIPYTVSYTNGAQNKHKFVSGLKYFVDDSELVANNLSELCENVFLIRHPWNENAKIKSNVIRVKSFKEVYEFTKHKI